MTIMDSTTRDIIDGGELPMFVGKNVSLTGFVTSVSAGTSSFQLRSSDNTVVSINLRTPLTKPLEGYVEVHGTCRGKSIEADEFIQFSNQQFDVKAHTALCKLFQSVPNLWSQ